MISDRPLIRVAVRVLFGAWTLLVIIAFYMSMLSFFGGRLMLILDKFRGS